jgi:hypothetical protein
MREREERQRKAEEARIAQQQAEAAQRKHDPGLREEPRFKS